MKAKLIFLKVIGALALNLIMLSAGHAKILDLEAISGPLNPGQSYGFGGSFGAGTLIQDRISFSLGSNTTGLGVGAFPFQFSVSGKNFFHIDSFNLTLEHHLGGLWSQVSPTKIDEAGNLTFSGLSSGLYSTLVTGIATGLNGGSYAGILAPVPAVPEPEEWAMMLVGVGLVGYQVRRKQSALNRRAMFA